MSWGKIIPWILVAVMAALAFAYMKGCFTPHSTDREGELRDSVFYWKDSAGKAVASLRSTKDDFNYIEKRFKDSIAGRLKTDAEHIEEIVSLKEKGKVTVYVPGAAPPPEIKYTDTGHHFIESVSQVFSNPWYQAIVEINLHDNLKSSAQLQTFDSLLLVWKTGHTGSFFSRKDYLQLDIKNSNPYNQIIQAQAYRVPPLPPKKWGIGVFIGWGYGFNVSGPQYGYPIIGVGLQRNFIRF